MAKIEERHRKRTDAFFTEVFEVEDATISQCKEMFAQALADAEAGQLRPCDYDDGGDELTDIGLTYRELDAALKTRR